MPNLRGDSNQKAIAAVLGEHADGEGVRGGAVSGTGVLGTSTSGVGVWGGSQTSSGVGGMSDSGVGVHGVSKSGPGLRGDSKTSFGVFGITESTSGGAGLGGEHTGEGSGVFGKSAGWNGVHGQTAADGGNGVFGENLGAGSGLRGHSARGPGVWAFSEQSEGLHAETRAATVAAVAAFHLNADSGAAALYAKKEGAGHAAFLEGNVHVAGQLTVRDDILLENADFAEDFDVLVDAPPGTVMVLGDTGALQPSDRACDRRVVGVVCGAGRYKPGIVLDKQPGRDDRRSIALVGKVYCLVDASHGTVCVGDLLTTSPTRGHAMRASDTTAAFGAVLGKALRPLSEGCGLIPILVSLQ